MSSCHHVIHLYSPHSSALFPPLFGPENCMSFSRISVACPLVCTVTHVTSNTLSCHLNRPSKPSFSRSLSTHNLLLFSTLPPFNYSSLLYLFQFFRYLFSPYFIFLLIYVIINSFLFCVHSVKRL
jgi:hypothetical protein